VDGVVAVDGVRGVDGVGGPHEGGVGDVESWVGAWDAPA